MPWNSHASDLILLIAESRIFTIICFRPSASVQPIGANQIAADTDFPLFASEVNYLAARGGGDLVPVKTGFSKCLIQRQGENQIFERGKASK